MLSLLRIKNFALIDYLELEFNSGLNVLTGETGAGKSIILDAIDLVLGGKINPRSLRQGTTQGLIEATFTLTNSLQAWLVEQEIEPIEAGEVISSREFRLVGNSLKSRSRVNGILINRQLLTGLREHLIEITAQGQTLGLMNSQVQRELLDLYGGEEISIGRTQVFQAYQKYQFADKALILYQKSQKERLQRLDLLQFQLQEFSLAQLSDPDELEHLEQESERLSHVVDLQELSYKVYQLLYQSEHDYPTVTDLLGQVESMLVDMSKYDPATESILEIVQSALNQVVEAGYQVSAYGDRLEADPEHLQEVEERIRLLKRICRKYGPTLTEAINQYQTVQEDLTSLTTEEKSLEELERDKQSAACILEKECHLLSTLREQTATKLEQHLVKELKPLAMEKVIFSCQLTPSAPTSFGAEQINFYFSPNAGEKIQPLSVIASGGEMSRFLLALKACFAQYQNGHTLIFDEIDAGVSGKVAQAIALKLHQLSKQHQVLCVTHQPLVAAFADAHFRVSKQIIEEAEQTSLNVRTVVRVVQLDTHHTRREELAQLTGGHSAEDAVTFAESLLLKAASYRLSKE